MHHRIVPSTHTPRNKTYKLLNHYDSGVPRFPLVEDAYLGIFDIADCCQRVFMRSIRTLSNLSRCRVVAHRSCIRRFYISRRSKPTESVSGGSGTGEAATGESTTGEPVLDDCTLSRSASGESASDVFASALSLLIAFLTASAVDSQHQHF